MWCTQPAAFCELLGHLSKYAGSSRIWNPDSLLLIPAIRAYSCRSENWDSNLSRNPEILSVGELECLFHFQFEGIKWKPERYQKMNSSEWWQSELLTQKGLLSEKSFWSSFKIFDHLSVPMSITGRLEISLDLRYLRDLSLQNFDGLYILKNRKVYNRPRSYYEFHGFHWSIFWDELCALESKTARNLLLENTFQLRNYSPFSRCLGFRFGSFRIESSQISTRKDFMENLWKFDEL